MLYACCVIHGDECLVFFILFSSLRAAEVEESDLFEELPLYFEFEESRLYFDFEELQLSL